MEKPLFVDCELLAAARAACGVESLEETIVLGLRALLRKQAYERLAALRGSEPNAELIPRRRFD